ncbi:MAG: hypothetical protein K6T26_02875 [Alicyclobacillus sp.]|nr:hypothetical protein [Alicyclobacillus sp.]
MAVWYASGVVVLGLAWWGWLKRHSWLQRLGHGRAGWRGWMSAVSSSLGQRVGVPDATGPVSGTEAQAALAVLEDMYREFQQEHQRMRADVAEVLGCLQREWHHQWTTLLTRVQELEKDMAALREEIQGMRSAPPAAWTGILPESERYLRMYEALQAGDSLEEVARRFGAGLSEVQLVLEVMGGAGQTERDSVREPVQ